MSLDSADTLADYEERCVTHVLHCSRIPPAILATTRPVLPSGRKLGGHSVRSEVDENGILPACDFGWEEQPPMRTVVAGRVDQPARLAVVERAHVPSLDE